LVVDDDPMIRDYARAVLERHGYMVLEAADGEAALAIAGADAAAIDVALVDRTLPGIGGPALLEAIVRRRRGVEVLLMSGYDEEEATRGGVAEGLAGFLRKPFSPAQLLEAIRARTGAR